MAAKQILVIVACLCTCVDAIVQFQGSTRTWLFGNDVDFIFGGNWRGREDSYLYAECSDNATSSSTFNCKIIIETISNRHGNYDTICYVELLKGLKTNSQPPLQINPFSDGKVIIESVSYWYEGFFQSVWKKEVMILDMSNCAFKSLYFITPDSSFLEILTGSTLKFTNVVRYNDKFDVIFSNKETCTTGTCRISYDEEGRQINSPRKFSSNFPHPITIPVDQHTDGRGFFHIVPDEISIKLVHVNATGESTFLEEITGPNHWAISVTNGMFAICTTRFKRIQCKQFDAQCNRTMNVDFEVADKTRVLSVRNLESGDLLLMAGICYEEYSSFVCGHLKVIKITGGKVGNALDVNGQSFTCASSSKQQLHNSSEDNEYVCFIMACEYRNSMSKYNTYVQSKICVPRELL